MLIKIADYFKCDFDYLLGQQTTPRKIFKHISDETGLTEKAVDNLICPDRNSNSYAPIISDLLEDEKILSQIALCCHTDYTKIHFFDIWDSLAPSGSKRHICRPDYIRQSNEMELYNALCNFINNIRIENGLETVSDK